MERLNIEVLQNAINSLDIMPGEQTPFDKVIIQALREYKELRDLEEQGLLLQLPCRIGETVYVATNTLSVQEMEFEDEEVPKYITGRIISFKINSKEKRVKVGVRARWWKEWFDNETGPDGDFYETERSKSFPLSAFGKTIFFLKEAAEAALAEQENKE